MTSAINKEVMGGGVSSDNREYFRSFLFSFGLHLTGFLLLIWTRSSVGTFEQPVVYSITLEGGKTLGGMMQVPKKDEKSALAPPKQVSAVEPPQRSEPEKKPEEEAPKESPQDAEVSLATPRPTPAPKKTVKPTPAPKATPVPKATPQKKGPKEPTISEINKQLEQALQRYKGESSRAGGTGFGAASLGGKGMGGGLVRPPEFFAYLRILERHIKDGWRWYDDTTPLRVQVEFEIAPDGIVSGIRIAASSGSAKFDDSVLRAIKKASPVPPPPPSVYEQYFKSVRMTFDPQE